MNAELTDKLARLRALVAAEKAAGALVNLQANFAWLAGGGEAHVALISERAAGHLLVTPEAVYLLANRIEMPRLLAEPAAGLQPEPLLHEWAEAGAAERALRAVVDPRKLISDTGDFGSRARPELIKELRYALHPAEVKRLTALGRDAEAAMNATCRALTPGLSENAIAGRLGAACWERDITPAVLLIAVDERIQRYRHPLPTPKQVKRLAMLVLCARRHGLIVSLTRLVSFGPLTRELRRRHDAVCGIDAAFIAATEVGAAVREVFGAGRKAYAAAGYPDEWKLHHQGGPCGYAPRDYVGTPDVAGRVLANQAYAWNPSITGTKSEDTILATPKGPRIITAAQDWPMVAAGAGGLSLPRPDILVV